MRLLVTIVLGLPWLIGQLYVPVLAPLAGLGAGVGDLVARSRWRAEDRAELEKKLQRELPGEVAAEERVAVLARVAEKRASLEAKARSYGLKLARGILSLVLAGAALSALVVWLRRERLERERARLALAALDGAVGLLGITTAIMGLALEGALYPLGLISGALGLVASAGWIFFGEFLGSRFLED
ncbi:MAG: hypothetical protein ACOY3Y_06440 [Acidobacteriota bacterium]